MTTTQHETTFREQLDGDGFAVVRGAVPPDAVEGVLRRVHLEVLRCGLSAEQIGEYHHTKVWFPHLRWEPEILAPLEHLPDAMREGTLCEPQILLHLPDEADDWPLEPHVDAEPPWSEGRPYRLIVGVALSPGHQRNGGLVVWPFDGGGPVPVDLDAGDAVVMHPQLGHSGTLNREGGIRYALYYRFLE
jgi:hypothetical protein